MRPNVKKSNCRIQKTISSVTTSIFLKCLHTIMFWKALHQTFPKNQIISGEYSQENSSFFQICHIYLKGHRIAQKQVMSPISRPNLNSTSNFKPKIVLPGVSEIYIQRYYDIWPFFEGTCSKNVPSPTTLLVRTMVCTSVNIGPTAFNTIFF